MSKDNSIELRAEVDQKVQAKFQANIQKGNIKYNITSDSQERLDKVIETYGLEEQ